MKNYTDNNQNMTPEKKYYCLKLIPPRPTFSQDMTVEEKSIMQKHVGYWLNLMDQGKVIVFGPVLDPKAVYGLGIVSVENESEMLELILRDPANGLNIYEGYVMKAVTPENRNSFS